MTKDEILKLRAHLRRSFGSPALTVTPNAREREAADVTIGERKIGKIILDDEDGDRSFSFAMPIPVDRATLQEYLRKLFENDKLKIVSRMKKTTRSNSTTATTSSASFPPTTSRQRFTLQMAILDFDLEDL